MFSCALPKKWDLPVVILPVQRARAAAGSAPPLPHSPLDAASLPLAALHECIDPRWTLRCPTPRRPGNAGAARSWLVRDAQAMVSGANGLGVWAGVEEGGCGALQWLLSLQSAPARVLEERGALVAPLGTHCTLSAFLQALWGIGTLPEDLQPQQTAPASTLPSWLSRTHCSAVNSRPKLAERGAGKLSRAATGLDPPEQTAAQHPWVAAGGGGGGSGDSGANFSAF